MSADTRPEDRIAAHVETLTAGAPTPAQHRPRRLAVVVVLSAVTSALVAAFSRQTPPPRSLEDRSDAELLEFLRQRPSILDGGPPADRPRSLTERSGA